MFEILENNQVLMIEEVTTNTQEAVVKKPIGMKYRIEMVVNKVQSTINEVVTISIQWKIFSTEQGAYINDVTNITDFQIDISSLSGVATPSNGMAEITFSSEEPGVYTIKTINPSVDNAFVEVTVNG